MMVWAAIKRAALEVIPGAVRFLCEERLRVDYVFSYECGGTTTICVRGVWG